VWVIASAAAAQTFAVQAVNPTTSEPRGGRRADHMAVYTPDSGIVRTGTDDWSSEAVVVDGVVVSVGASDSPIPEDGFVASGRGEARIWINRHLAPGTPVQHDDERVWVDDSVWGQALALRFRSHEVLVQLQAVGASEELLRQADGISMFASGMGHRHPMQPTPLLVAQVSAEVSRLEERAWDLELAAIPSTPGEVRAVRHRLDLEDIARDDLTALVEELAATNVNVFFPETIYDSHAIYEDPAEFYAIHPDLEDTDFDLLDLLLRRCHARGIEVHPWVHCFLIGVHEIELQETEDDEDTEASPLLARMWPGWLASDRRGRNVSMDEEGHMFFNPALYEARRRITDAHLALLRRYPVDGLHLDHVRYPSSSIWQRSWEYSDGTRHLVEVALGFDPLEVTPQGNPVRWHQWLSWREQQITSFVSQDQEAIQEHRPHVRITAAISPGLARATENTGQNWARWQRNGLVDALMPKIQSSDPAGVARATEEVLAVKGGAPPPVVGLSTDLGLSPRRLVEQILAARQAGAQGQCLLSWADLDESHRQALVEGPWKTRTAARWQSDESIAVEN
jgi:uncharacterized lipoprotein YddW (UPF0748 family)